MMPSTETQKVKIICFPRVSLYLNVMEAYWNRGKGDVMESWNYRTIGEFKKTATKYFKKMKTNPSVEKYMHRSLIKYVGNL